MTEFMLGKLYELKDSAWGDQLTVFIVKKWSKKNVKLMPSEHFGPGNFKHTRLPKHSIVMCCTTLKKVITPHEGHPQWSAQIFLWNEKFIAIPQDEPPTSLFKRVCYV